MLNKTQVRRYAIKNQRLALRVSGSRFAATRPCITTIGMAEGNIIAPIITDHMSQTATISLYSQREFIGIIKLIRGEDVLAVDQKTIHQPIIDSTASVTTPFRIATPSDWLGMIAICPLVSSNTQNWSQSHSAQNS
jgi:hypothetical protein